MGGVQQDPSLELDGDLEANRHALDLHGTSAPPQEQSPSYKSLLEAGLIVESYRVHSAGELDTVPANSTVSKNLARRALAYCGLVVGGWVYDALVHQFVVNVGHIRPAQHSDGRYFFFSAGVHRVNRLFVTLLPEVSLLEWRIQHGDRTIVTVPQGFVGLAFDRGQPVLLAPGLHQWQSSTMRLQELIDLSSDIICIGPFTLITVDEGYAAITQDNGKQRILPGGATHMLTHRNWKFEALLSLKIHTDDVDKFRATTADNVVLMTSATVNWCVSDAALAARMATETTQQRTADSATAGSRQRSVLQRDVLKQATASLAATIGAVRYAGSTSVAASEKVEPAAASASRIFSAQQMSLAVRHSNEVCCQYGVRVISLHIVSAVPADSKLDVALSAGAVAAAASQEAEVAARGTAKANLIAAQAEAESRRIEAQALADMERVRAQGKKDAAALLQASDVAVRLARLEKASGVLAEKTAFFFGKSPVELPGLLLNSCA